MTWKPVFSRPGDRCAYCGGPLSGLDHRCMIVMTDGEGRKAHRGHCTTQLIERDLARGEE